jgi:hypothetical protein
VAGLQVLGDAGVRSLRCRSIGESEGIRVEASVQSEDKETFPPMGSVPLMPMVELLNALGAAVQIDDLFCFWIMYEDAGADRGSTGAP